MLFRQRCLLQSQIHNLTNAQLKNMFVIVLNNYSHDEPYIVLLFPSATRVCGQKFSIKTENVSFLLSNYI